MRYNKFLLFLLLSVFAFSACTRYDEVSVSEVRQVDLRSVRGKNVLLTCMVKVNNPTSKTLTLKEANLEVFRNGYHFANVRNTERVSVLPKSENYYPLDVEIQLSSILSGLALTDLEKLNLEEFSVAGNLKVSNSMFSRKIKFDEISLKQFVEMLK